MVVQRHDARPVTDLVTDHFRPTPLDLSVVRRLAKHDADRCVARPLHLRLTLVSHEDDGQRAVRKRCDLRRPTVVATSRRVHVLPPAPGPAVVVGKQRFDIKGTVSRRLEDHHQGLPAIIPSLGNTSHAITEALCLPVQTAWWRPRRTVVGRSNHHRTLVVVGKLLRVNQLHLATTALPHKGLPDTIRGTLLHSLRRKLPRSSAVRGPADGDAEMRGAVRANVVVAERRQNDPRRGLQQEHVVTVAVSPRHLAMLCPGLAAVGTPGNAQDASRAFKLGARSQN